MAIEARQLLLLLNWMSPAFPTGAFAYSHGLEWAIDSGAVKTGDDVEAWIADLITRGSGWNDAVVFAAVWNQDAEEVNELALALASSRERFLETTQLGAAFGAAVEIFLPPPSWGRSREARVGEVSGLAPASPTRRRFAPSTSPMKGEVSYPVAAARACRAMGIEKSHALLAFLQGFANSLVSVAVRLVPLGQTQGLETIRNLMPLIAETAKRAETATLDDLGSIAIASDIAAMKHETQYSRVFRT